MMVMVVFCMYVIPFAALLFLNGSIIATITKTRKETRQLENNESKCEPNAIQILFWIVLIFLVLNSFPVAFRFLFILGPNDRAWRKTWYWLSPVHHLALITNSSVNFLIYCMVGRTFRAEIFKLFNCKKAEDENTTQVKYLTEL